MDTKLQQESDSVESSPSSDRKQQIFASKGKDVSIDLIFYSCLEYERVLRSKSKDNELISTCPIILEELSALKDDLISDDHLSALLEKVIHWYSSQYPCLAIRGVIDREMLHEVVEPLVSLNIDIANLYRSFKKTVIPAYNKAEEKHKFWEILEILILKYFPQHGSKFIKYLQWSHATQPIEDYKIGDVPPVGRNAPRLPRRERDDRATYTSINSANEFKQGKERKLKSRETPQSRTTAKTDHHSPKKPSKKPLLQHEENPADVLGSGRGRNSNPKDGSLKRDAEKDVYSAVEKLKQDNSIVEVALKPTNSFFRRIQHQIAIEEGFASISVGDGQERAVKVCRKS